MSSKTKIAAFICHFVITRHQQILNLASVSVNVMSHGIRSRIEIEI
jgi:hypothetical protein